MWTKPLNFNVVCHQRLDRPDAECLDAQLAAEIADPALMGEPAIPQALDVQHDLSGDLIRLGGDGLGRDGERL